MKPKLQADSPRDVGKDEGSDARPRAARVARLLAVDERGCAWVQFDDETSATAAKLVVTLSQPALEQVMATRAPVLVAQQGGSHQVVALVGTALAGPVLEADVDGQRVKLSGEKEVVIACGKASITLRANGRVIIRGTQVESYSEGTNRIKGGQVRIN